MEDQGAPEPFEMGRQRSPIDRIVEADWGRWAAIALDRMRRTLHVIGEAIRPLAGAPLRVSIRGLIALTGIASLLPRLSTRRRSDPGDRPAGRLGSYLTVRSFAIAPLVAAFVIVAYLADCIYEIPIDGGIGGDVGAGALVIQASDGSELATRGSPRGDKLTIDEMPVVLKNAIVAIEDRRFYEHGALDWHGMARAMARDLIPGRSKEGASTLTQQLARLMLLSPDRTMKRKVQEALIAFWLEHHLTKQQILGRYLDTAYFGAGAYGVDAAAQRYFGKSARNLDLPEAAMIAGLVRAPSQLAPHRNLEAAQARASLVLGAMVRSGKIDAKAAAEAKAHPAVLKVLPEAPSGSGYAADVAMGDVRALVGNSAIDVTAWTTIDPKLQELAERVVDAHLEGEGARKDVGQAALVAIGSDGAILAMVGGRDYDDSRFNRATQARRQGGSLFKLFVYLTALRQGATPDTIVVDSPVKIGDWEPHNYEKGYRGRIPLHSAFAHSLNTVAAKLGQQVGIPAVIKTAHELGVTSDLPAVPSLVLGTAGVSLMEMTRAFGTVASDQDTLEPFLVRRVSSHDKVLFNRPQLYAGDNEPDAAKLAMRELLADVVQEGTGRAAQLPFATGGKTGTTQDFRDAWFIGSAPDVTVGVWVGNDDNTSMRGVTGGDVPAKVWHDFVAEAERMIAARNTQAATPVKARVASTPNTVSLPAKPASVAADEATAPVLDPLVDQVTSVADTPPSAAAATITGEASVATTANLDVDGHEIVLQGVEPLDGRPARALSRYLRRREVACAPSTAGTFRCSVDGIDLATTIVANGGSAAKADAPAELIEAQRGAQERRQGIWRHRR